jgi:autotransporter translocation and assembly factor TamB
MIKHLLYKLCSLLVFLVVIAGIGYFILGTEIGTKIWFGSLSRLSWEKIRGEAMGDLLHDSLQIKNFSYQDQEVGISSKKIELALRIGKLWKDRFAVKRFIADDLTIVFKTDDFSLDSEAVREIFHFFSSSFFRRLTLHNVGINNLSFYLKNQLLAKIESVDFQAKIKGDNYTSLAIGAHNKDALLNFDGSITDNWQIHWLLNIPNLKQVFPDLTGSIVSGGDILGQKELPEVKGNILLKKILFNQDNSISNLSNDFQLVFSAQNLNTASFKVIYSGTKLSGWQIPDGIFSGSITNTKFLTHRNLLQPGSLLTNFSLDLKNQNLFNAQIKIFNPYLDREFLESLKGRTIDGEIKWRTDNLYLITKLFPLISNLKGETFGALKLNGLLFSPKISGELGIQNLSFVVSDFGLHLHDANFSAKLLNDVLSYHGKIFSEGLLEIDGETDLKHDFASVYQVKGNDFLVYDTKQVKIKVSPEITAKLIDQSLVLTGKVLVPYALFKLNGFGNTLILPRELVYAGEKENYIEKKVPFQASSQIQLTLGDQVTIEDVNFKGRLTGKLQIDDQPYREPNATGTLVINDGTYNLFGQKLELIDSTLSYVSSPISNPSLNIRARKLINVDTSSILEKMGKSLATPTSMQFLNRLEGLTSAEVSSSLNVHEVGIRVKGSFEYPQVDLYSIPGGISKADIFSYLIIDKPADQSGEQTELLLSAANSLNFGGIGGIYQVIENIRHQFGLNEFGLTTETEVSSDIKDLGTTTTTAVVLGKYITPRLYLSYTRNIADALYTIRVRYRLGKNWAVQSERGSNGAGFDVLYSMERD